MSTSANVTSGSERVLRSDGIPLDDIVQELIGQAASTLVFVDACRNDPRLSRAIGGNGRGLSRLDPVKGGNILIGVSTRLGDTAADGDAGKGSPFARAFAADIEAPGLRIDDAFRKIRDAVRTETAGKQVPDIVQDDLPQGALILATGEAVAPPPEAPSASKFAEAAQLWASLQTSSDATLLQAFRQHYEGTFFADMAEIRLKQLAAEASQPHPQPGQQFAIVQPRPVPAAPSERAPLGDCDTLAASSFDADAVAPGVPSEKVDGAAAVAACAKALTSYPGERRLQFQYARALSVTKAFADAKPWYEATASAGSAAAMNNLGNFYAAGRDIAKDDAQALQWFRKAADAGNSVAMLNVGDFYEKGRTVAVDFDQALTW